MIDPLSGGDLSEIGDHRPLPQPEATTEIIRGWQRLEFREIKTIRNSDDAGVEDPVSPVKALVRRADCNAPSGSWRNSSREDSVPHPLEGGLALVSMQRAIGRKHIGNIERTSPRESRVVEEMPVAMEMDQIHRLLQGVEHCCDTTREEELMRIGQPIGEVGDHEDAYAVMFSPLWRSRPTTRSHGICREHSHAHTTLN
jgi:hypothetical protein